MTVFNSYSTGTVTVAAGGTTVTGTGTTWSGINAKPGDDLVINGFTAVVMDVVDATHLTIKAWPFAAQTAQPYAVVWRSPLRYVGGQAMADVDSLIQYLTGGVFPTISGGTAPTATLTLQSTSGAGSTDAIIFKTATQIERARIDNPGNLKLTTTTAAVGLRFNSQTNPAVSADPGNHYNYFSGPDGQAFLFVGDTSDKTIYANTNGSFSIFNSAFANISFSVDIPTGIVQFQRIPTTASAANAFLDSAASNSLKRSTSSLRYKRDIEPLDPALAEAALRLKPIWYRSNAEGDNPEWSFYGYGAEDVAAEDPRLCQWGYADEDYEIVEIPIAGTDQTRKDRAPRSGAQLVPDYVMYDRVAVLQIAALKARIEKLEARETT